MLYGYSCLPADNYDYSELDTELDWDETSSEWNGNGTEAPFSINDIDESTIDVHLIESATKNITIDEQLAVETKLLELSGILKTTIHRIRKQFKKLDIVFLIDSSSSVGKSNFRSELRFVIKFLSDFNVSFNYTRVSIVTFSSQEKIVCISYLYRILRDFYQDIFIRFEKVRHVDHISEADSDNDKCKLLNLQIPSIEFSGGGTHTAEALLQAKVCFRATSAKTALNFVLFFLNCCCIVDHSNESTATQQEDNLSYNRRIFKWSRSNANR